MVRSLGTFVAFLFSSGRDIIHLPVAERLGGAQAAPVARLGTINYETTQEENAMRKLRKLGTAMALSAFIGAGMITFSTTVHAQGSERSIQVRCALLQRAIDAATAAFGPDSELVVNLQGLYATYCAQ